MVVTLLFIPLPCFSSQAFSLPGLIKHSEELAKDLELEKAKLSKLVDLVSNANWNAAELLHNTWDQLPLSSLICREICRRAQFGSTCIRIQHTV